jgi:hypothetical protein
MDNAPERKRPNAKYPLSEKKTEDDELVFYYSRERRLAAAPPKIRALYEQTPKRKFGFFRSLTATKPLAMMFASILLLCAAITIISILDRAEGGRLLGGNLITLEAVKFQGETIVVLTKTVKTPEQAYTGPVDIGAAPEAPGGSQTGDYPVFTHRIFFSLNAEEEYRFSLPFDAEKLLIIVQGETGSVRFTVKTK